MLKSTKCVTNQEPSGKNNRICPFRHYMRRLCWWLLFVFCCGSRANGQEPIPHYKGAEIDFGMRKISTLYKGEGRQLAGNRLDVRGIANIAGKENNVWYLECQFRLDRTKNSQDIWLQLRANINAAEVYINHHLLLTNGVTGSSRQTEKGGSNLVRQRIPDRFLQEGVNQLRVKFSNFKNQRGAIFRDLSIGGLAGFQKHAAIMSVAPLLFAGVFIFAVFINIALYFSLRQQPVFLLLAALFVFSFSLMIYEVLYWNGLMPAISFIHNNALRRMFEYLGMLTLSTVLVFEYRFSKKYILATLLVFALAYSVPIDTPYLVLVPLGLGAEAVIKGLKNSILITASLLLMFALSYADEHNLIENYSFVHHNFIVTSIVYKLDNVGMVFFALAMVFTSAKRILAKSNALHDARLKLERLEYQFLQKHIQPHFLMNSLMSLQYLIGKDAKSAGKMVEALAEEFHLLTTMNKKKLIPVGQEIDMCKMHLKIMSIQQKASYQMEVKGMAGNEMIPPTVIHTLVENGITHGYSGTQNARFELSKTEDDVQIHYRLFNDGKPGAATAKKKSTGTGLKYVEARLEHCYPGQWLLYSAETKGGWEAIISINKQQ